MESVSHQQKTICLIDDDTDFNSTLSEMLKTENFQVLSFFSATVFMGWFNNNFSSCDLIISDVNMSGMSGYDLCRTIRAQPHTQRVPIIFITGNDEAEKAIGLEAGADDFIQKPTRKRDLLAKVSSLLKIKDQEVKKVERLTRFISPNIAELIVKGSHDRILKPHRVLVTVMFVDLRGFTAFSKVTEAEEVMSVLNTYYMIVGSSALRIGGTIGHMAGDGIMIFFNDPQPMENHQEAGVELAMEVRKKLSVQRDIWNDRQYNIDFGIGVAEGYATIGEVGFDQFWQYSVIGPVVNFASRICSAANSGQILVSHRFLSRMKSQDYLTEFIGHTPLKGISKPVALYNVLKFQAAIRITG